MTPDQLADLHARCFETPRPWSADEFEHIQKTCFLLEADAGFLLGRVIADEAEVLTLAVAPEARRKGIGSGLVADFLAQSKSRNANTAFLEVAADNENAQSLYRRHGFAEAGRRRAYYTRPDGSKVDAVIMTCPLTSP